MQCRSGKGTIFIYMHESPTTLYIHQIKLFMPSDECVIHMHSQNYYGFLSLGLTSHKIMAFSTIQITCFSFYMFLAFFYFCMWIHVPIGIGFIQFLVFWGTSNNKDKILYMSTTTWYKMHAYMAEVAHIYPVTFIYIIHGSLRQVKHIITN